MYFGDGVVSLQVVRILTRPSGKRLKMSFEDGGDLASFAAIAESTIANKEGKLRIDKPPKLANRASDHFVSLDVRVGEHFVIAFRVGHPNKHTILFANVYRCLDAVFSAN